MPDIDESIFEDGFTLQHFRRWLDQTVHPFEQQDVVNLMEPYIRNDPELVNSMGWSRLRDMAESLDMNQEILKQRAK